MQIKNISYFIRNASFILVFLTASLGCKKFLEPEYKLNVLANVVFANDGNANAAVNGLYATMATNFSSSGQLTMSMSVAADELDYFTGDVQYDQFKQNNVFPDNEPLTKIWQDYYNLIYQCNALIEGTSSSTGMSASNKSQVIGEAKFFRAFFHFYLLNLFGPVPLIVTTDRTKTVYALRSSQDEVYRQIKTDLTEAMNTLPVDYSFTGQRRIRASKWAAAAMLARANLYHKDWADAEAVSTSILKNIGLFNLQPSAEIDKTFFQNNKESILELDRTHLNSYTREGAEFLASANYYNLVPFPMLSGLYESFEAKDLRKTKWTINIDSINTVYKYKLFSPPTNKLSGENYQLLRLAEQYLIRAEARAQQNNLMGAKEDIDAIRGRAGLDPLFGTLSKANIMQSIEDERRHELFCEWGHRWFDLKRWPSLITPGSKTRADDILSILKPTWKTTSILFPLPKEPRANNPGLTQNEGYN